MPESLRAKPFQINAVSESPATTTKQQLLEMLQTSLVRTFKLKLRNATRESPGYALLTSANGLKLKESSKAEEPLVVSFRGQGGTRGGGPVIPTTYRVLGIAPLSSFASLLGGCALGSVLVIDKTGLRGNYDFDFELRPIGYAGGPCSPEFDPSLGKVLERELGLTLQAQNVPERAVVIDHAELPSD